LLDPGLKEKVVLVTGTNNPHGIGAAAARAFAAQGARVFLHYFQWSPKTTANAQSSVDTSSGESFYYSQQTKSIDEVLERVRKSGVQAAALEADLTDPSLVKTLFDRAEAALGPVEVLVNNAAYWGSEYVPPFGS
jgi:3-oxoacyl-[acyl-carrier protein] reductase